MNGVDEYKYDVFFSYKRSDLIKVWVAKVVERVSFWLTQELGGMPAKVFVDEESIEVADRLPEAIRLALQTSKCMVGVWSPEYFQSFWCVTEWRTFLKREEQEGLEVSGLVVPIRYHDGKWFPTEAQNVKMYDFSKYTSTVDAFWDSPRAVEFEEELKKFANALAGVILRAPPFQPDWPIHEVKPTDPPVGPMPRL